MGRLCKGSPDLAKLEPALSRHPSGRISTTRGFLRRYPEPHLGTTLNNLENYETNTSNQSEPAHRFSVNRSQLSADRGPKEHRGPADGEADRLSQVEQRFS